MTYTATPSDILKVRYEVADTEAGLYIVADEEIAYQLEKSGGSISRASLDTARLILLKLALNSTDETVSILSLRNSKQAEQYRLALLAYVNNPYLNPLMGNASIWAGNISKSEMQANNNNCDNNIPSLASPDLNTSCYSSSDNPFLI